MDQKSKWINLLGKEYKLVDLGRPAVFLIPIKKLKQRMENGKMVEKDLQEFLISNFGAYTSATIPGFGFWKDAKQAIIFDRCREYEVSFLGKKKIPTLIRKLAEIAEVIDEECIYLKTGQYSCLVYPKKQKAVK
jgi:hypothetical protein